MRPPESNPLPLRVDVKSRHKWMAPGPNPGPPISVLNRNREHNRSIYFASRRIDGFSGHFDVFSMPKSRAFCDGTRWYGVPAPFSKVNKKLFVMFFLTNKSFPVS